MDEVFDSSLDEYGNGMSSTKIIRYVIKDALIFLSYLIRPEMQEKFEKYDQDLRKSKDLVGWSNNECTKLDPSVQRRHPKRKLKPQALRQVKSSGDKHLRGNTSRVLGFNCINKIVLSRNKMHIDPKKFCRPLTY